MMRLKLFLLFFAGCIASPLAAQIQREVTGIVRDTANSNIIGAMVTLAPATTPADTLLTRTDQDGRFVFNGRIPSQFTLTVRSLGYTEVRIRSVNDEAATRIVLATPIILREGMVVLEQVVINGAPPVVIKQDTVEYSADAFKLKENAVAEDLLKRLDGVEVDRNGNVTAQGKSITRVRVNGRDFFGGDLKTATKNLPVNVIDKIQLVDDYGDQANFTGIKDGDPETIINITTKPRAADGIIANATVGGGTDRRYQLAGFANRINGERNIGFTANLNNNGAQIGGSGFGGRGGPSTVTRVSLSGGSGSFGASDGSAADGSAGITTLSSIGLNYSNQWGPKLNVTGGYYFNSSDNNTVSNVLNQYATAMGTVSGSSDADITTDSRSHNMNARIVYTIGPKDMLIVSPSVGFTSGGNSLVRSSFQTGVIRQDQVTNGRNRINTPSVGGNVLYTHRFRKAGRDYSLNVGARSNGVNNEDDNTNRIRYYDPATGTLEHDSLDHRINKLDNMTLLTAVRFIYSEPLSQASRLQFSYNMNYNHYDNSRVTNRANPAGDLERIDSLSNAFNYSFASHQFGVNYAYKASADELSLGVTANPAQLSGNSADPEITISRANFFLAPIFRYTHTYSRTKNLQVTYTSRAGEPTFFQLQPVRDASDPQRPVVGNPELNSSFSHTVNASYNASNPQQHRSFFLRFQGSLTNDRIVPNVLLIPDAYGSFKREVHYRNTDGTYAYNGTYSWQQAFADRQYTIRLNGNAGYNRNVAFADNVRNIAKEWGIWHGVGLQINPGSWLEFTPTLAYRYSTVAYTLPTSTDIAIHTYSIDVDGNVFFLHNRSLIWRFNGVKNFNTGYSGALNVNPLVVNSSIEKAFLSDRSATLKFEVFDLFNQANNIHRNITDNGFADISTNRLTQYFMLSLTMRLNPLTGNTAATAQRTNDR
ncbi:TonB-dependent receptor [Parapedobacter lycopersici]|uniref:TonB-dependent receptor n=1 Tax=Parapedobacter lycopersici TaxID=1864939 RepID=UPI00214DE4CB|nr:TonB-dependent receptor [Parapedobacter lycopersici]